MGYNGCMLTYFIYPKSELLRVIGGPSIGDLRSRLTRLINLLPSATESDPGREERAAIKTIMSYRLPAEGNEHDVKDEWSEIVEGRHRYGLFQFWDILKWI
jgi:hypothetical protein